MKINIELHPQTFKGTWQECMDYAEKLGDGWRVPTRSELVYIYDNGWLNTNNCYWSSTICPVRDVQKEEENNSLEQANNGDEKDYPEEPKTCEHGKDVSNSFYLCPICMEAEGKKVRQRESLNEIAKGDDDYDSMDNFFETINAEPKEEEMNKIVAECESHLAILNEKDRVKENAEPTKAIKHDQGKVRFDLIPPKALEEVAKVFTFGAEKYSDWNWQGLETQRIKASLLRHVYAFLQGESTDPETHQSHLAHATCNCLMLLWKHYNPKEGDRQ